MTDRPDLAVMVVRLGRTLLALEEPILAEHGVSMWAYAVLSRLAEHPVRGQAVLADAIGADKTRLIAVLDDLQRRDLIRRDPDPDDRRARRLALTDAGRGLHDAAQQEIRRGEQRLLGNLPADDRDALLRALRQLTGA